MQVKEDICGVKLASLLKAKGFDGDCYYHWVLEEDGKSKLIAFKENKAYQYANTLGYLLAPSLNVARKWLKLKHNVDIIVKPYELDFTSHTIKYEGDVWMKSNNIVLRYMGNSYVSDYNTYSEALEALMIKACEDYIS